MRLSDALSITWSRQNESPGNRIASNFNRIRPARSVSVNKCSISCSLNVRFLAAKRTKLRAFYCETLIKWLRFNGKLPITLIVPLIWRYADLPLFVMRESFVFRNSDINGFCDYVKKQSLTTKLI